jgi:hypothetical protein
VLCWSWLLLPSWKKKKRKKHVGLDNLNIKDLWDYPFKSYRNRFKFRYTPTLLYRTF